MCNVLMRHIHL